MEKTPKSITVNGLTHGALTGVVMIIYSLILYVADLHMHKYLPMITFLLLIAGLIYGTIEYRNKVLGGLIPYGKAFGASFMIALFAVFLYAIYSYVFYQFIAPDAILDLVDQAREKIMNSNPDISEEKLEAALNMQSAFFKPIWIAVMSFIVQLVISAVVALITSAFIKKEDKSFSANV